jgi:hypothetical protein
MGNASPSIANSMLRQTGKTKIPERKQQRLTEEASPLNYLAGGIQ